MLISRQAGVLQACKRLEGIYRRSGRALTPKVTVPTRSRLIFDGRVKRQKLTLDTGHVLAAQNRGVNILFRFLGWDLVLIVGLLGHVFCPRSLKIGSYVSRSFPLSCFRST